MNSIKFPLSQTQSESLSVRLRVSHTCTWSTKLSKVTVTSVTAAAPALSTCIPPKENNNNKYKIQRSSESAAWDHRDGGPGDAYADPPHIQASNKTKNHYTDDSLATSTVLCSSQHAHKKVKELRGIKQEEGSDSIKDAVAFDCDCVVCCTVVLVEDTIEMIMLTNLENEG